MENTLLESPFTDTNRKEFMEVFKPTRMSMIHEINRRSHFAVTDPRTPIVLTLFQFSRDGKPKPMKPSSWKYDRLYNFLKITTFPHKGKDHDFLQFHIEGYKKN